jgi:hypothetical protein
LVKERALGRHGDTLHVMMKGAHIPVSWSVGTDIPTAECAPTQQDFFDGPTP